MNAAARERLHTLFGEDKTRGFTLTGFDHPNVIILKRLREMTSNFSKDDTYNLIDYLTEWIEIEEDKYNEKSPIDKINTAMRQRFYESRRDYLEFENYVPAMFEKHSSSPDDFFEYLIGREKFEIIKNRISNRTEEYNSLVLDLIKNETGRERPVHRKNAGHRKAYS